MFRYLQEREREREREICKPFSFPRLNSNWYIFFLLLLFLLLFLLFLFFLLFTGPISYSVCLFLCNVDVGKLPHRFGGRPGDLLMFDV